MKRFEKINVTIYNNDVFKGVKDDKLIVSDRNSLKEIDYLTDTHDRIKTRESNQLNVDTIYLQLDRNHVITGARKWLTRSVDIILKS